MSAATFVVLAGLLIGLVFGAVGLVSGFCMMSSLRGWWAEGDGRLVRTFRGVNESHFANFLGAVRSRKVSDLHADILEGHQSTALCQLGNISWRLGRPASPAEIRKELPELKVHDDVLETFERTRKHLAENNVDLEASKLVLGQALRLDPEKEQFLASSSANALLTREYRKPFVVPAENEV